MKSIFETITTILYLISAIVLTIMALSIMYWSLCESFNAIDKFSLDKTFILTMLQSVGTVIISITILDIAKYMIEEEVFRNKELRDPNEARKTLTKIMTIIAIAVSVEGLVYIFKAGTKDLSYLIYPSILILTSSILVVALGYYQKLSSNLKENNE